MAIDDTAGAAARDWRPAALRLAALFGVILFHNGVGQPFFPLWLASLGLDGAAISILMALPWLTRIAATPLVARIADRRGDIAGVLAGALVLASLFYVAIFAARGPFALGIVIVLISATHGTTLTLLDALTLGFVRAWQARDLPAGPDYGRIRMVGSAAFVVGILAAGGATQALGMAAVPALLAGACVTGALCACEMTRHFPRRAPPAAGEGGADGRIARPLLLVCFIVAAALIQASHSVALTFAPVHWRAGGLSDIFIGCAWSVGVVAEVALFWRLGHVVGKAGLGLRFMALGGGAAALRWGLMALDPGPATIVLAQALHGLTFGATHLGTIALVMALSPEGMRARAQSWMSSIISLFAALATMASGPLYAAWGEASYGFMAVMALAGVALACVCEAARRRLPGSARRA